MALVHLEASALERLHRLGLTVAPLHRALLRADAEAALVTALEPSNAEGITRYNKTTRFLREELLPQGWSHSNRGNFCRTISPDQAFALVASSGDGGAGMYMLGQQPSTKYPKGEATVRAVAANQQLMFDLGRLFDDIQPGESIVAWYLLYQVTVDRIYCEVSLPASMKNGYIDNWVERIMLPPVDRPGRTSGSASGGDDGDAGGHDYQVSVSRRA